MGKQEAGGGGAGVGAGTKGFPIHSRRCVSPDVSHETIPCLSLPLAVPRFEDSARMDDVQAFINSRKLSCRRWAVTFTYQCRPMSSDALAWVLLEE